MKRHRAGISRALDAVLGGATDSHEPVVVPLPGAPRPHRRVAPPKAPSGCARCTLPLEYMHALVRPHGLVCFRCAIDLLQ